MKNGMFSSRKAKALLIALANCDLIFFSALILKADPALCSSLVTATLTLAGLYIGAQGAVDAVTAAKTTPVIVNNQTASAPIQQ